MLHALHTLRHRLAAAFRREDGSVTVEAVIILPALFWCYLATVVFFDAYRSQAVNIKTAYTLGDTLSRETGYITSNYMDSLLELQGFLVQSEDNIGLRISVIRYLEPTDEHQVVWSQVRGTSVVPLNNSTVDPLYTRIPIMVHDGRMILVETWVDYSPAFDVGMGDFTYYDLSVTRPRFAGQLCWNTVNTGGGPSTATC